MTTLEYDFSEMKLPGYGDDILIQGTAILESDCEDDSYFYVASLKIGKTTLKRPSRINSAHVIDDFLFTEIVKQIEDDKTVHGKHAALEWTDAVSGLVSDFVPALRRRHGMPMFLIPELAPLGGVSAQAAE
ncbi:hypothetical protein [Rhizobium lusitanum]|jgi:hypothetical protein|uniref:Uncharacterized protein n=1 Tax=Rhizobium lusitanum TaxID=293958 RepID=A0A1C3VS08_9HYPH|nr:hypothetical protein [Rhizobium lusitanum]SCB30583.1 hypothetical protein GA0061101_106128 [Rhizobium lusitanum]